MSSSSHSKQRVLIVDDDPLIRQMAQKTLQHAGFEVCALDNGYDALDALQRERFNLVLLDVILPTLDGYTICRRLRTLPGAGSVPVIMLTGQNDDRAIEDAYAAGASDFMIKPIPWPLLIHRVRYALRAVELTQNAVRHEARFLRAQQLAHLAHWELRPDGQLNVSDAIKELLKLPLDANLSDEGFMAFVSPQDQEKVSAARLSALNDGQSYDISYQICLPDGQDVLTVIEQAHPQLDADGRMRFVEGITLDISARVKMEEQLWCAQRYDNVTGLPNQHFFMETAAPILAGLRRRQGQAAMLHVAIPRFADVLTALGTTEGEMILGLLGQRLQATMRQSDVAAFLDMRGTALARIGENAFVLLLVDIKSDTDASRVAKRLQNVIAEPLDHAGQQLILAASVGIAMHAATPHSLPQLLHQAFQAARAANETESGISFYDRDMTLQARLRLQRESELRKGIARNELRLFYQPKVNARTGQVTGAEALVRWMHPSEGLLPPATFISVAEDSGLIEPLTDWVLDKACQDRRHRLNNGLPDTEISVNLAGACFGAGDLIDRLQALLQRYQLDPKCLTLELTETMLMSAPDQAAAKITQLRDLGFHVSLDDFGTGYSSLSYLRQFAVNELKIDRSFVAEVEEQDRGVLACAIIALARELRLEVVAEGVETVAQAEFLMAHGCFKHQGYLYARPMPVDEFNLLLQKGGITPNAPGPTPAKPQTTC